MHYCQAFIHPRNFCGPSWPGIHSDRLILIPHSMSRQHLFCRICFGYYTRCGEMLMMGCQLSRSTISPCHNWGNLEMHSEAAIDRIWQCTWTPWSSEFGDALGGHDLTRSKEYLEAINLEAVVWAGGAIAAETLFIVAVVIVGMSSIGYNLVCPETGREPEDSLSWDDVVQGKAVISVCCTQCMLNSVSAVLGVCCTQCMLYAVNAVLSVGCTWCMLHSVLHQQNVF